MLAATGHTLAHRQLHGPDIVQRQAAVPATAAVERGCSLWRRVHGSLSQQQSKLRLRQWSCNCVRADRHGVQAAGGHCAQA